MSENLQSTPRNSAIVDRLHRERMAEAREVDNLTVDDIRRMMTVSIERKEVAEARLARAEDAQRLEPTPRHAAEVDRARGAFLDATRDALLLHAFWDTGARLDEVITLAWDRIQWLKDGYVLAKVHGKAATGTGKRPRRVPIGGRGTRLLIEYAYLQHGDVPRAGPVFAGDRPDGTIHGSTAERAIARLAELAGAQRVVSDRKTHKFSATPKAIRDLSESYAVMEKNVNPELASRVGGHGQDVMRKYYLKGDTRMLLKVARAREIHL